MTEMADTEVNQPVAPGPGPFDSLFPAFMTRRGGAALAWLVMGSVWFVVGTFYGLLDAIHLVAPEFFNNIPALAFGRLRPSHVNTVLFGFTSTTLIGCGLYYVPAVLKTRLWSEPGAWIAWLLWNITVLSGPISFANGYSQGREYCEYLWLFDCSLELSLILLLVDVLMTIRQRAEKTLYVSVWYFTGMLLWTVGYYPLGNVMWHPSTGALPGLIDSLFLWAYGHNLPGLLLTPLANGAAFFVIPRITRTPIYSYTLSLVAFWTLVALYSHIGGHHIIQAPIPNWLKVMSTVDSFLMVIPVFAVLLNWWATARGRAGRLLADPAGRLVILGTVFYLLTCIQGPIQSLPVIQRITHFNNWEIGHAHLAVLGFSGFIAVGALWHILPLVTGKQVWSQGLILIQTALLSFGVVGFLIVLSIAGLIQGHAWNDGVLEYRVLPQITVYYISRAFIGISIVIASVIGLYNVVKTITSGRPIAEDAR